jgi:hypothetical protein
MKRSVPGRLRLDFARIMEVLDQKKVAFVSATQ